MVDVVDNAHPCKVLKTVSVNDGGGKRNKFEVGGYRNFKEHIREAFKLPHPIESTDGVPDDLKRAAFNVVTKGMHEIARLRNEAMKDCVKAANDLRSEESQLHASLDPCIAKITSNKKICLFKKLLQEVHFEDMEVVSFLQNGVPLTGWETESDLFATRWNPPTTTVECLDGAALWQRKAIMARPFSSEEKDSAHTLWDETRWLKWRWVFWRDLSFREMPLRKSWRLILGV